MTTLSDDIKEWANKNALYFASACYTYEKQQRLAEALERGLKVCNVR